VAGIFLSYRRSDAEGQAGRLYDDLAGHFGPDTVFMDVAGIEAGRDFRQAIDQHVTSCSVLLAIIGKEWVAAADSNGRRRLDDPNDFVRLEVATALKRDIPVVPLLVRGAVMPQATELPADCADLCYRNAMELTHARWNSDVQVLIKALTRYVGANQMPAPQTKEPLGQASDTPPPAGIARQKSRGARTWLIAIPIAMAIIGGGVVAYRSNDDGDNRTVAPLQPADPQPKPGEDPKPADQAAKLPADNQKPQVLVAADAADKQNQEQLKTGETGSAVETSKPKAAGGNSFSEWMPTSQFQTYRQARPPSERFPYDIELQCVKKGENNIRAKFGPQPQGVQEVRFGHLLFRGEAKLPVVEGFREFSRSQCKMPNGGQMLVRVMVRP
jgi:hypothetical protein